MHHVNIFISIDVMLLHNFPQPFAQSSPCLPHFSPITCSPGWPLDGYIDTHGTFNRQRLGFFLDKMRPKWVEMCPKCVDISPKCVEMRPKCVHMSPQSVQRVASNDRTIHFTNMSKINFPGLRTPKLVCLAN